MIVLTTEAAVSNTVLTFPVVRSMWKARPSSYLAPKSALRSSVLETNTSRWSSPAQEMSRTLLSPTAAATRTFPARVTT